MYLAPRTHNVSQLPGLQFHPHQFKFVSFLPPWPVVSPGAQTLTYGCSSTHDDSPALDSSFFTVLSQVGVLLGRGSLLSTRMSVRNLKLSRTFGNLAVRFLLLLLLYISLSRLQLDKKKLFSFVMNVRENIVVR